VFSSGSIGAGFYALNRFLLFLLSIFHHQNGCYISRFVCVIFVFVFGSLNSLGKIGVGVFAYFFLENEIWILICSCFSWFWKNIYYWSSSVCFLSSFLILDCFNYLLIKFKFNL